MITGFSMMHLTVVLLWLL